jgi:hypothetical protein
MGYQEAGSAFAMVTVRAIEACTAAMLLAVHQGAVTVQRVGAAPVRERPWRLLVAVADGAPTHPEQEHEPLGYPRTSVSLTTVSSVRASTNTTGATPGSTSIRCRCHSACTSWKRVTRAGWSKKLTAACYATDRSSTTRRPPRPVPHERNSATTSPPSRR